MVFEDKQTLDVIMIPTGGYEENRKRTGRALDEYFQGRGSKFLMISGGPFYPIQTGQVYGIYKQLRERGIKPSEMIVEGKSDSTLDNVLYSIERLQERGAEYIGISSSPDHLDRFEDIIDEAKKEGLIGKDFRIHRIEVSGSKNLLKKFYGIAARLAYKSKLKKGLGYAQSHPSGKLLRNIRDRLFK